MKKDKIVRIRLSEAEKDALKKEAQKQKTTMSKYLREQIPTK